ncbi:MAG: preprotein translocase subunit SecA [bacterium]
MLKKLFGKILDSNEKQVAKLRPIVNTVNELETEIKALSDEGLKTKTTELKVRLEHGEKLDDILPEALATIRESIRRTVNQRAYDVQLISASVLNKGMIAEQKTGEGKTLSATMAAYVNALEGKGVHVITVNDYLARRDAGWYGRAHHFLGLKVACIIHEQAFIFDPEYIDPKHTDDRLKHLKPVSRQEAYLADITYGTNNEFGFDYLRDNMVMSLHQKSQRPLHYAIVDEVDSILIDEARTPLIISGASDEAAEKYFTFARITPRLEAEKDYTLDEKMRSVIITEDGLKKVEKLLGLNNIYESGDMSLPFHLEAALKAEVLYKKDKDYIVREDEVVIVDEFTGRLMPGRRYSEGLHQAIEAKENVKIQRESQTLATITFQNYFRMYKKLAGMTGTAETEAEEFIKIYELEVVVIPTNRDIARKDYNDLIYKTEKAKYKAIAQEIKESHEKGQPVLLGTISIEKNEKLSEYLRRAGIPHNILNAKNHEREAEFIANAGQKKAVTLATNMAGRGTDIVLGEGVREVGGLKVIGSERHEARRIDNQLRGRSGRQGDPGETRFYVSLEDDLMRIFGGERVQGLMDRLGLEEDQPIEHGMISKSIESAQKKVEGYNFDIRKRLVEYDDVMNKQREVIYSIRQRILEIAEQVKSETSIENIEIANAGNIVDEFLNLLSSTNLRQMVFQLIDKELDNILDQSISPESGQRDWKRVGQLITAIIPLDTPSTENVLNFLQEKENDIEIRDELYTFFEKAYSAKIEQVGEEIMLDMEKVILLRSIDSLWIEHLRAIDELREGIGLRGYGQRDPLVAYKSEAFLLFEQLLNFIQTNVVRAIFRAQVQPQTPQPLPKNPSGLQKKAAKTATAAEATIIENKKVGRNDPCPCGSGKKFKKCHGQDQ